MATDDSENRVNPLRSPRWLTFANPLICLPRPQKMDLTPFGRQHELPSADAGGLEVNQCCRIVLTGGPGGGKTTAADLYRREIGEDVVVVPEAATLLYTGGFPRVGEPEVQKACQRAIYQVQLNLEDAQSAYYRSRILLCDRGTVDGAAYWPGKTEDFFDHLGTTLEKELARYDAVIFFETAAVGGISIEGGNPIRIEPNETAILLDQKLKSLWSQHHHFVFIPHNKSFIKKVTTGLEEVARLVALHEPPQRKAPPSAAP
jgi:predicted ATPase